MPKRAREKTGDSECEARRPAEIFADFQEAGSYLTEKLQSELENFYQSRIDDANLFEQYFYKPVLVLLNGSFSSPFVKKVIPFVVEFLVKRLDDEDQDEDRETMSPFLTNFFGLFWKVQNLDDKNLRYNTCKIVADLLAKLAEKDISMDEALCEKISNVMISERITDKAVDIRELAAKVLQWLQDSSSPQCQVTKTLMYHLDKDPSVEVRKTILALIRVSSITLPSIVKRTRDVNEAVRVMAYKILGDRRKMSSLSYALREKIIMSGLQDSSSAVKEAAANYMLPKWLEYLQGNLVEFVKNLDVHYRPSVPRQALPHLFKDKTPDELIAFLELTEGEKYPTIETMTPALALYWSSLAKYFKDNDDAESLEKILGSVTELTAYVYCYYKQEIPKDKDLIGEGQKEENVYRITNLIFLLDLFSFCELTDETGRARMADLLVEILKSDDHRPDRRLLTKVTAQLLIGYPDPYSRVEIVGNLLHDIYEPYVRPQHEPVAPTMTEDQKRSLNVAIAMLKKKLCEFHISKEKAIDNELFAEAEDWKTKIAAVREDMKKKEDELKGPVVLESQDDELERKATDDPSVQYKCLVILCELLRSPDVFEVTIGFADIIENFVLKCIAIDEESIMVNALEALGLYCMHNHTIARNHLPMFYVMLINDLRPYQSVKAKCLQCIVTLLVLHGPEKLQIPEEEWVVNTDSTRFDVVNKDSNQMGYLISIINNMDTGGDNTVQKQAIIGACQLLLSGRIKSSKLLTKIILLWFLPATSDNNCLLKLISQFLSRYAADNAEAPSVLTEALVAAIDAIMHCTHASEIQELDPKEVGLLILDLTKPGTNKYTDDNQHDKIARLLLEKLEFEDSKEIQNVYLKLLVNLAISYQDNNVRLPLLESLRRVKRNNMKDSSNRDLLKLMLNLQGRPEVCVDDENISSTPRSPLNRRTLIVDKENIITPIRRSIGANDDEDMDSDDDNVFKTPPRMRSIRT